MILLLGGTSETAQAAEHIVAAGYDVLVSTATSAALDTGTHPRIHRRCGRLDATQLTELIRSVKIRAVVDASHPYATTLHTSAMQAACAADIPYLRMDRPTSAPCSAAMASDHQHAAELAFSFGAPVLLTTGSRNLQPYALQSRTTGIPVIARVLDHPDSIDACKQADIPEQAIVLGRGPFSVEDNRQLLRKHSIGVLVTKDSGTAGGIAAKYEAARLENCRIVCVRRPPDLPADCHYPHEITTILNQHLSPNHQPHEPLT